MCDYDYGYYKRANQKVENGTVNLLEENDTEEKALKRSKVEKMFNEWVHLWGQHPEGEKKHT